LSLGWRLEASLLKINKERFDAALQLTLPDDRHIPSQPLQGFPIAFIARDVALDFTRPIFAVGLGHARPFAAMPVPEAAMYEHGEPVSREDKIRFAWEVGMVQAKTKSRPMDGPANLHFRCAARGLNPGHDRASLRWTEGITHGEPDDANRTEQATMICKGTNHAEAEKYASTRCAPHP